MKAVTFAVFALLCITLASCRPDKTDLKQLKAEAARKKACLHDCTSAKLEPVCAGKNGEKPKSFGSVCVMNNYNCEHSDSLQQLKLEAAWKKACTSAKLEPVCAGKNGEKPKSLGSICVMNNYNCEQSDTLAKISNGECPGGQGIRLS